MCSSDLFPSHDNEMMGLQHRYNEAMAQQNQQRNKEMWNYTNFENQRAHLENAGLSIGLMYGQGGAGGASTSGGQGKRRRTVKVHKITRETRRRNFKIKITDEESEEYYNTLRKQHNEEGIKTHKDDIKEIIIKKLQNIS